MTERIPAKVLETIDPSQSIKLTPAQAGGPIHTRSFTGLYRNLRRYGAGFLFLLFFGTSWLNYNGHQAVLWDLADRKFYIFGATFWPQDFILLSALLIICAFGLFFITVLAGRVWCGYTCPQSVWTWMFMWVEKLTEGDRNQRIKLDAAPWSVIKLLRRTAKHALWLLIGLLTAIGFVGYFTPVRELVMGLLTLDIGLGAGFWVLAFSLATYMNAGWLREQVCLHMCPYSRFQSVMFDEDTLIVSYDAGRGEGRGARKKDSDYRAAGLGDCVDCTLCVQVCPTGIDIRDGLQLDCISCGACIDACDNVMDKMGYARGLVRYTSERALAGAKTHVLRPRLLGYAAALVLMVGLFIVALGMRPELALTVSKDRGLYRINEFGQVENAYRLKVINKTQEARQYRVHLQEVDVFQLASVPLLNLAAGEVLELPVTVSAPRQSSTQTARELTFVVQEQGGEQARVSAPSTFIAPMRY